MFRLFPTVSQKWCPKRKDTIRRPIKAAWIASLAAQFDAFNIIVCSVVIPDGHFIDEQILVYLSQVYCSDSKKIGTERVSHQQKLSYLFLQDIRAVKLISFSTEISI